MTEYKYRNKEWLYKQYYEKERSITDIAEELDRDHTTISKWRRKLDIPKPPKKISIECPVCGKEFERMKSKVERVKYSNVCSRECLYEGRSSGIIEREVEGGYNTSETVKARKCPTCKKEFETTLTEDYKYCSRDCFLEEHSKRMSGEDNPSYINGSSYERRSYRGENWDEIKMKAYERDNYVCQSCDVKCISRSDYNGENGDKIIQGHHIEEYQSEEDNYLENVVTLCASCHTKLHNNKEFEI